MRLISYVAGLTCLALCYALHLGCVNQQDTDEQFRLLSSNETGVSFENTLEEGPNTNILMYEYFYNGGGVATGDVNGDGFIDLYFTSNMSDNRLYLHTGEPDQIRYRDVTSASRAGGRPGPWKTGVNMVDINGDGRLDIYLCYSGAVSDNRRRNQLFLNMGNDENDVPRFEERALAYGLAGEAYSNHSYFFDYDRDGDLDMLLLNHNPQNLPVLNEVKTKELVKVDDPQMGIRLFRNEFNRFDDVTVETGISGSALTYGLGIGISDLNDDGWPDFYVSNDYAVPDFLYINQQDGSFRNEIESLAHISQFSMGNDIGDVNNDGLPDIITLDMLPEDNKRQKLLLAPDDYSKFDLHVRSGFYLQYMRNMLHVNNGDGTFSEVGQWSGMSNTDWSWSVLSADFDLDGWKDMYVTNGYTRDYTNQDFINYMESYVQEKGRLKRDDVLEIIEQMPASDVSNYMFQGKPAIQYDDVTSLWGLGQPANSNGAAYADLDNDGDLDLIVNNVNQPAFIYQNQATESEESHYLQIVLKGKAPNTSAIGAMVKVFADDRIIVAEQFPARGYQSSVSPILNIGLGQVSKVDSLLIQWPTGGFQVLLDIEANQRISVEEKEALPVAQTDHIPESTIFTEIEPIINRSDPYRPTRDFDRQNLLPFELSHHTPCLASADVNGDGLEDIYVGGGEDQHGSLFMQTSEGQFKEVAKDMFLPDKDHIDWDALFFDANGDGYQDLYVASGGYHNFSPDDQRLQDRLYMNDGTGSFTKVEGALPRMLTSSSVVVGADINLDGHIDLFVGGRLVPGRYPEKPNSHLLINDGNGRFVDGTSEVGSGIGSFGMITDAVFADVNGDEHNDLVVAQDWGNIRVLLWEDGQLHDKTPEFWDDQLFGLWNHIDVGDFNGDDKPDFVLGNFGKNSQIKATSAEPAELYFDDFDDNGSVDPIMSYYIQGTSYPFPTRNELLAQLVVLRSTFTSFESYSEAAMEDIFNEEQLSSADKLKISQLESSLLLSQAEGRYEVLALPAEAQYSPVYASLVYDYNQDGIDDLLLCGNHSRMKLRLGRCDANYGQLYTGNGDGTFSYVPQKESGFRIRGDVRSLLQVNNQILIGINQSAFVSYQQGELYDQ